MKFAFACLIASLSLVAVHANEREGYYYQQRERLGHFKDKPFIDLYLNYATAFVKPDHPDRASDDFRNYMPSAEECVNFFSTFRIQQYVVKDLDQYVVLDACLGYLFESDYQEEDRQKSKLVADELDNFLKDEKLRTLYDGTQVDKLNEPAKECIGDLLFNIIQAKFQYQDVVCNNHYLQIFVQFGACHNTIPGELVAKDTYLKAIYDLVKERANFCFKHEVWKINEAVRLDYAKKPLWEFVNSLLSKMKNQLGKQVHTRRYPEPIVELLTTFQGDKREISLRRVHNIILGVWSKEENFIRQLFDNMAKGFTALYKSNKEDPSGTATYRRYVDKLCLNFRRTDRESYYDYATSILRMARLLSYPEVFGITTKQFIDDLLVKSYESGAIYLSVSACNLLTFTEGAYELVAHNGKPKFEVKFMPDTTKMVRWPDAGYY